jgi:hypothetical protein
MVTAVVRSGTRSADQPYAADWLEQLVLLWLSFCKLVHEGRHVRMHIAG